MNPLESALPKRADKPFAQKSNPKGERGDLMFETAMRMGWANLNTIKQYRVANRANTHHLVSPLNCKNLISIGIAAKPNLNRHNFKYFQSTVS